MPDNDSHEQEIQVSGSAADIESRVSPETKALIDNKIEDALKVAKDLKKDILTTFGIFASLLIFASLEVQVFSKVPRFSLMIGLSAFFVSALLMFVVALHNILHEKNDWRDYNTPVLVLPAVFFLFACICFAYAFLYPSGMGLIWGKALFWLIVGYPLNYL